MDNTLMWIWWSITILLCVWKIGEGFVRPHRMLEWPFLACAMWAYFYGYMAYDAKVKMPEYLGNGMSDIGQLMPLLCLVGLLVGWNLGTRNKHPQPPEVRVYPYFRIWLAGMFFLVVGAAGAYSVMHAINSGTINFQEDSGYWILLFYVGYPGLAMVIWSLFRMPPSSSRFYLWVITLVALAAFMFPHIAGAKRGPLFPTIMILLLVPPLTTRRSPNPLIFFGALAVAGVVMLVFLQIRVTTYNGGTWSEAIHHLDVGAAVTEKVEDPEDNEYINSCQLISTIYLNGKYQYGTGHMGLLWHWVPRAVWKDKPTLGEGSYSFNELFDDVEATTGFRLLGGGAAAAGVADTFVQYGVFCPFFWLLLSWGMGAVYIRARIVQSPRWLFCYIGFICASHWLVSQSLAAAFVPGMFFQIVPVVVFLVLDSSGGRARVPLQGHRTGAPLTAPTSALSP
jgi:hypothetical protein